MNRATRARGWRFAPRLWATVLMLVVVVACVRLGVWQQGKAERKEAAQAVFDLKHGGDVYRITLGAQPGDPEALQYAPVRVVGQFEPEHQFFVDNRFDGEHGERAGLHVITPLRLQGTAMRVLVNRGWIPAPEHHSDVPVVATPSSEVVLDGTAVVPSRKFFTLMSEPAIAPGTAEWPRVWQNLDWQRFVNAVDQPVQPVVVLLDADQPHGFARAWVRPDDRFEKHWSYAYQWYGFAVAFALIWGYLSCRPASEVDNRSKQRGWSKGQTLGALVFLFAAPVLIAVGLYFGGWRPAGSSQGELLQPPVQVPALQTLQHQTFAWQPGADSKWSLVVVAPGDCAQDCQRWIAQGRNVQVALNKNMERLQRVWVGMQAGSGLSQAMAAQPDLRVALADSSAARDVFGLTPQQTQVQIYLVDPMGWVVLRYSASSPPQAVFKDLEKLLRYAWAG